MFPVTVLGILQRMSSTTFHAARKQQQLHPGMLTGQWKTNHFEDVSPTKMVIFHYVMLVFRGGTTSYSFPPVYKFPHRKCVLPFPSGLFEEIMRVIRILRAIKVVRLVGAVRFTQDLQHLGPVGFGGTTGPPSMRNSPQQMMREIPTIHYRKGIHFLVRFFSLEQTHSQ